MKKALLVTTVSGFIPQFEMNNVKLLQEMGYEVHYASNYEMPSYGKDNHRLDGTDIVRHQIDFVRSPYSFKNFTVYCQLKKLMQEEAFDLVHCHTPMGGAMARLAAHVTETKPVIYTAHGFHFFRGASLKNWLVYYTMERWLSRYTNQLICINEEDYQCAQRFKSQYVDYIPGVGLDLKKYKNTLSMNVFLKKEELGLPFDKKVLLSAGELIKRKNHESIIRAIAALNDSNIIYIICGHGELENYLKNLVKELKLEESVYFLGYRADIMEIYRIADLYVFPSFQEGLPMALLEAMASGLPVLCSEIRGSRDLMGKMYGEASMGWNYCEGGITVKKADDVEAYAEGIHLMLANIEDLKKYGERNEKNSQLFSSELVSACMRKIYQRFQ